MLRIAAILLLALMAAGTARAQQAVDVAIVMAIDASSSVNFTEFDLQIRGVAEALRSPEVQRAVAAGPSGAVAFTMVQWSGPLQVGQSFPWTLVATAEDAEALARTVEDTPRYFTVGSTAIGQAINYSAGTFDKLPWAAGRRVIDISGDGQNTDNPPIGPAREAALRSGITINGLPILAQEPDIDVYYRDQIIGGAGAFIEVARDYEALKEAMTRKLVREIRTDPLISWVEGLQ